jgi:hypothetical protein
MGVYEGRGLLSKSLQQLQLRWQEAKSDWNDTASDHFEKKFLEPLENDLRSATTAMDHLAAVLVQVRRDCQ